MVLLNFSRRFEELNLKIEYFFVVEKKREIGARELSRANFKIWLGRFF